MHMLSYLLIRLSCSLAYIYAHLCLHPPHYGANSFHPKGAYPHSGSASGLWSLAFRWPSAKLKTSRCFRRKCHMRGVSVSSRFVWDSLGSTCAQSAARTQAQRCGVSRDSPYSGVW
jgi:hypothetical protein